MVIYVHANDIFDRNITWSRHARVRDVRHVTLGARETLNDMVIRILAAARRPRSIWTLILNAHGLTDAVHGRPIGALSMSDVAVLQPTTVGQLTPLRPYFTPGAHGVEIHGCAILGADAGWRLCQLMCQILQVSVYASPFDQRGVSPTGGSTPRDLRGGYEGSVIAFRPPNGRYENAINQFRGRGLWSPS